MYLIDGHNLIPKIPGHSLREMDDELALVALLQTYSRVRRKQVVVYFDGAPPGNAGERVYGMVRAHFVPSGITADEAIRRQLVELGRRARNVTVVSSDRQVKANGKSLGARVVSSEEFAGDLLNANEAGNQPSQTGLPPQSMTESELGEWLDLFGIDPKRANQAIDLPSPIPPKARKRGGRKNRSRHGFLPKGDDRE